MEMKNLNFSAVLPTQIIFGIEVTNNLLIDKIKSQGAKNIFLVTDPKLREADILIRIIKNMELASLEVIVFSDIEPNPTTSMVEKGANLLNKHQSELIVAIGGGSVIDVAKAIAVINTNPGDIFEYRRGGKNIEGPLINLFAVPTTAGTGSEVTPVSVLSDLERKQKFSVASTFIYPKIAFVDPSMTLSLPKSQIAATGLDALTHGIESYTSNRSHPISDSLSFSSIKLVLENLYDSYTDSNNIEAKTRVMLGSTMAGLAFSMVGNGLVHSMSRPLTSWFDIPHGIANAMLLPYVSEYNSKANPEKYSQVKNLFNEQKNLNQNITANSLLYYLREFTVKFDIPNDFSNLNIPIDNKLLSDLAEGALENTATLLNNPRQPSKQDIIQLYRFLLTEN